MEMYKEHTVVSTEEDVQSQSLVSSEAVVEECKIHSSSDGNLQNISSATDCKDFAGGENDSTTVRTNFSSENFKIRIDNLNYRVKHNQIKEKLTSLNLKPRKIKKMDKSTYVFATFGNEEERLAAIEALDGLEWKGKKLTVKKAAASEDPILQRKREAGQSGDTAHKIPKLSDEEYENKLLDKVTPFWKKAYGQQLKDKYAAMLEIMKRLKREMLSALRDSLTLKKDFGDLEFVNKLQDIKPSPQIHGYRNKCEFTIGKHPQNEETTVGFRLAEYKQGTVAVVSPAKCFNVSEKMKNVVNVFQTFVRTSEWPVYDPVTQKGHWMWLLVRTTTSNDLQVMPTFVKQELSQVDLDRVGVEVKRLFEEGGGKDCSVSSLYINFVPVQSKSDSLNVPTLLAGKEVIEETLLSLRFRISPSAFFQVNSSGAEVLYSTIADWAGICKETTVYDVCCGTGTIGMLVAKHAKTVVGIDIEKKAIEDAEQNALLNGITNITFKSGKAEDVLPGLLTSAAGSQTVAIVDPPRAGLHTKVTQALRRCTSLQKLVYVSCEPKSALKNFVELMRPASNRWKGTPFSLVKAVPVDMFPHTDKCELVLLFTRESA